MTISDNGKEFNIRIKPAMERPDIGVLAEGEANFSIGSHTKSVRMKAEDLLKVMKPVLI